MIDEMVYGYVMSESTGLLLKSTAVMIAGLLVASGRLDASQANDFVNNLQIIGGVILASLGGFYLLEHAFQSAMAELKWKYSPEEPVIETSEKPEPPVVTTQTTTSVAPTPPTA